jgi:hypothetical protein
LAHGVPVWRSAKAVGVWVYPAVSLAQARKQRDQARELLVQGVDPGRAKQVARLARAAEASNTRFRMRCWGSAWT